MLAAILKQNHSQGPHSHCFFNVCAHLSLKYSIFLLSLSGCPILSMMGGGSLLESSGVLGVLPSSQGGLFDSGGNSQKYFRNDFIHCIQSTKMTVSGEFLGVHHWQSGPEYYFSLHWKLLFVFLLSFRTYISNLCLPWVYMPPGKGTW